MSADDIASDERRHFSAGNKVLQPGLPAGSDILPETGAPIFKPKSRRPVYRLFRFREFAPAINRAVEVELDYATPFLLVPVCLGAGALCYFSAGFEPAWRPLILGLAVLLIARWIFRKHGMIASVLLAISLIVAGALAGKFETGEPTPKCSVPPSPRR